MDDQRRKLNLGLTLSLAGALAPSLSKAQVKGGSTDFAQKPVRDAHGKLEDGFWTALPLNTWVKITGTEPVPALRDQLLEVGFANAAPFTESTISKHVAASFRAWVGGALDEAGGKFYVPYGGGHSDGGLNGIWRLDLDRLSWKIERMPSHPLAKGAEWSDAYCDTSGLGGGGNYTQYRIKLREPRNPNYYSVRGDGYTDLLPDLRPTSRHQYKGVVFDSNRERVYTHRYRRLSYSPVDRKEEEYLYDTSIIPLGQTSKPDNHAIFDSITDSTYIWSISSDYWGFYRLHETSRTLSKIKPGLPAATGPAACELVGRKIYFVNLGSNGNRAAAPIVSKRLDVFDIDKQSWERSETISNWPMWEHPEAGEIDLVTDSMQPFVYVPEHQKFLLYISRTRGWYWIDPRSHAIEAASFSGIDVPHVDYIGTKLFYFPRRKCIVYAAGVDGNGNDMAVHLMRVG